jgi:hypothetical protein
LEVWFGKIQIESKLILIWFGDWHDHFCWPKANWKWINIDKDIELKVWDWKRDWKLRLIGDIDIDVELSVWNWIESEIDIEIGLKVEIELNLTVEIEIEIGLKLEIEIELIIEIELNWVRDWNWIELNWHWNWIESWNWIEFDSWNWNCDWNWD